METKLSNGENLSIRVGSDLYPTRLQHRVLGRHKSNLGDLVGVQQFGVNLTVLKPGAESALRHWHEGEDEFIYLLEGTLILIDNNGEHELTPGCFAGFAANCSNAHHLVNRSQTDARYLEVGSRKPGEDVVHYPDEDYGPIAR